MEKRQIRIDQGRVIPMFPRLVITTSILTLLLLLIDYAGKPDLTFLLGFVLGSAIIQGIWSSRKVLLIDQEKATYSQFYWVMGFKKQIHEGTGIGTALIIRRKSKDQKTPGKYPYETFLKLDSEQEIFLISRDNAEDVTKIGTKISKKLGLRLESELPRRN